MGADDFSAKISSRISAKAAAETTERQGKASAAATFRLPQLPYAYDALEPVIDRETLAWHHDHCHRSYVDRLNARVSSGELRVPPPGDPFGDSARLAPEVLSLLAGDWNHAFFWAGMTDKKEDQQMSPELVHALEASFGSVEEFKSKFVSAGVGLEGSGWVWLFKAEDGRLAVAATPGNDNPLMRGVSVQGSPLLVCDLWEHAYFSKYKLERADFLRKFFALVDWSRAHDLLIGRMH